MWNNRKDIIQASGWHLRGTKNRLLHVAVVGCPAGAFHHAPQRDVTVTAVMHLCSGFKIQRIIGKLRQSLVDARVMAGIGGLFIISVIANAALMRKQLSRSDGPWLLRECRAIFLNGLV